MAASQVASKVNIYIFFFSRRMEIVRCTEVWSNSFCCQQVWANNTQSCSQNKHRPSEGQARHGLSTWESDVGLLYIYISFLSRVFTRSTFWRTVFSWGSFFIGWGSKYGPHISCLFSIVKVSVLSIQKLRKVRTYQISNRVTEKCEERHIMRARERSGSKKWADAGWSFMLSW